MAVGIVGPAGVTTITPPSREVQDKFGIVEVADGSTGFAAFGIPKDAVICGVYTICTGANTTQTINVGFTNGGTEILNAFADNSTGYSPGLAQTGTSVGTKLTADKTVYLKASATLTTPVIVRVSYFMPPQGQAL